MANPTVNQSTENTSTSAFPTSIATPPTTTFLSAETILIIAAAVPSGIAFILAMALITVTACWCCSCRRAKEKERKSKPSLAIGIETLEEARTRSLRESHANRLQLLQDGAIQLGHTNPQDVQHDEYYQNSDTILNQLGLREQEQGDDLDVATKETASVSDDDDEYENVEPNSQVLAAVHVQTQNRPVLTPIRQQSNHSDDDKDEHDYVNVPKEGKPKISPKALPVLARVAHLMDN